MAATLVVSGIATISTQPAAGGGYTTLGIASPDGVTVEAVPGWEDVNTDTRGPIHPEDVQYFGETHRISFQLVNFDRTQVELLLNFGDSVTNGTLGTIGELLIKDSLYFSLRIASTISGQTRTYNVCHVENHSENRGTRATRIQMTVRAIPNASGVLYTEA